MTEYSKTTLLSQIGRLEELLLAPQHSVFFAQSGNDVEELRKLFNRLKPYEEKWGDVLYCNHDEAPDELIKTWSVLFESEDDEDEERLISLSLYNRTLKFLRSLMTIPYKAESVRRVSSKSLAKALEKASEEQANISAQLEEERGKAQPDQDTIRNLEKLKQASDIEIEALHQERGVQEIEEASERDWNEKIREAFTYLHESSSDMQDERKKVDTEYHFFLYGLILPAIILLIWLCKLYGLIISLKCPFDNWMCFLPYYLPVPLFVAVFWIFIVQKNRASKLSIALSERLYHIKYLEGLLMTVNRLAPNSQESINRINQSLDTVVKAFVSKIVKESMDEHRVEELEKNEISQDVYFKIIEKLTDIVKK